jgi:hypothetical protein
MGRPQLLVAMTLNLQQGRADLSLKMPKVV